MLTHSVAKSKLIEACAKSWGQCMNTFLAQLRQNLQIYTTERRYLKMGKIATFLYNAVFEPYNTKMHNHSVQYKKPIKACAKHWGHCIKTFLD